MTRRLSFNIIRIPTLLAILWSLSSVSDAWGQFETRGTQPLPNESLAAATGDFNHDGKLDVAVVGDYVSILLGKGDGTFEGPVNYAEHAGPFSSIVVADFNNDGNLDLAVTPDSSEILIFLGNGDGTFRSPKSSPMTEPGGIMSVADFNDDHKLDIAVVNHPYVSVLVGNGDGTFQSPIDNDSFVGPQWLTVGDFNNDHRPDVVVVGSFGSTSQIGMLLGNGDGTLQDSLTDSLRYPPNSVAAADFDGDGNLDVAIGGYLVSEVTFLFGKGNGRFESGPSYSGGGYMVIAGDFNGDGNMDVIAESPYLGAAEFLGNGDGTFQAAKFYRANLGVPRASGDLNGDHRPDLVLLDNLPPTITSMLDTGTLSFSPSSPLAFGKQPIGTTSKPMTLQISNTGTNEISIASVKVAGAFEVSHTCGSSIAAGHKCTVIVTLTPSKEGVQIGAITILDSASSKPQHIELKGVGTTLGISP